MSSREASRARAIAASAAGCIAAACWAGALLAACISSDGVDEGAPPPEAAIYVSTGGDDNASGAYPAQAVASIPVAIQRALGCAAHPCPVRIAEGTYTATVNLEGGVSLFGGYAEGFATRDPELHEVVLTSTEASAVVSKELALPVALDGLTIRGATFDALADGSSTYALAVSFSKDMLTLKQCKVVAGNAAHGEDGAAGHLQMCDAAGGQGAVSFDCGGSVGAHGEAAGDPASGGEGGTAGDSNCPSACPLVGTDGISNGGDGSLGGNGENGLPGAITDDVDGSFVDGEWSGAVGKPGERGKHGTGGGGGGSGGSKKFAACFGCSTLLGGKGGDGGPGGCGGGGGQAGGAGGGSFAIVLQEASIALEDVSVTGGRGGDGGAGGDGIDGAPGGVSAVAADPGGAQTCGLIGYDSGGGGAGGPGGKGGRGGGGAGGVGGVSIAIAMIGASETKRTGVVDVIAGEGGFGGLGGIGGGGAQPGFDGDAAPERTF